MNATKHLAQAIEEYTLIHQHLPTVLRVTYDVRADLERNNALPDGMEIELSDAAHPVLVVR
jgi:hypothetical protein